jgi:hypothetical protein
MSSLSDALPEVVPALSDEALSHGHTESDAWAQEETVKEEEEEEVGPDATEQEEPIENETVGDGSAPDVTVPTAAAVPNETVPGDGTEKATMPTAGALDETASDTVARIAAGAGDGKDVTDEGATLNDQESTVPRGATSAPTAHFPPLPMEASEGKTPSADEILALLDATNVVSHARAPPPMDPLGSQATTDEPTFDLLEELLRGTIVGDRHKPVDAEAQTAETVFRLPFSVLLQPPGAGLRRVYFDHADAAMPGAWFRVRTEAVEETRD